MIEIIRAVFDEFSQQFPIHANDVIDRDLGIDCEDLDDSIVAIAERVERSLEKTETNPMYDKIETIHDLVAFLQHQPVLTNCNEIHHQMRPENG